MRAFVLACMITVSGVWLVNMCRAQELRVPASIAAGEEGSIPTTGSGKATFYLVGPGVSVKTEVNLGDAIHLQSRDLRNAGSYLAVACSNSCRSAAFYVTAAKPASLTFLVHPSRVPVGRSNAISGVALPFDQFRNLVLEPSEVKFQLSSGSSSVMSRAVRTQNGVAWFRTASGKTAGILQVAADLYAVSSKRAVQQVASEPCNLRIKGERTPKGIVVETEPVRDCTGNPVPDGTVIAFTAISEHTKSTVDAPVKRGIARAQMDASGATTISAASGVVMGNELRIEAQR